MIEIIQKLADWQTKTAADIAAELAETVETQDQTGYTVALLVDRLGMNDAGLVVGTIRVAGDSNPILASSFIALSTTGLQLHKAERQAMIDSLAAAGAWSPELTSAVKALGRPVLSRWANLGGSGVVPDSIAVQSAMDAYRFEQRVINAAGLFRERMTPSGDAAAVMGQAWTDAGA